ncbi:hypothetical protein HKT18_07150 [Flavobacterium sp. IMCC34852]|uniref:Uncharacterized protein n=1 Tax=Flavobacterium rivulicola TaxID=2732161 RepID=A0A7Y3VYS5_9FLAO|nr:hypothetical protein [Flavobacterium sp. IMCC34852]NNT71988.1 hypothetical protein [Flavobacterium sp. IMCC34852]
MTIFLAVIFLGLIGFIIYLLRKMLSERDLFVSKIKPLEAFMLQLNEDCKKQSLQLQLSEDLKIKMKEVNTVLNKNIFELNYQLAEDLYPKKEM